LNSGLLASALQLAALRVAGRVLPSAPQLGLERAVKSHSFVAM